jgi:glycosyltransferase involved in cell wall biosynthesis
MKILLMHHSVPEPDRGGSDVRLMQIFSGLLALGHTVELFSRSECKSVAAAAMLGALGVKIHYGASQPLTGLLAGGGFSTVILCLWFWEDVSLPEQYADCIRRHSSSTRIIVLTDDCHCVRQRMRATCNGSLLDWEWANDIEDRERSIYAFADHILCISDADKQEIQRLAPKTPITVVPFCCDVVPSDRDFADRAGLATLGNFHNPATLDSLQWFLEQPWAAWLAGVPGMRFTIGGNQAPSIPDCPNVESLGYISDLGGFFSTYRVFVSPVRFGTGISTKSVLAMAHGVPLVTTTVGARPLLVGNGVEGMVADNAKDFAAAVLSLHSDRQKWQAMSIAATEHVQKNFSRSAVAASLAAALRDHGVERQNGLAAALPQLHGSLPSQFQMGGLLVLAGNAEAALARFRRAATMLRRRAQLSASCPSPFYQAFLTGTEACYRALGNSASAERCAMAALEVPCTGAVETDRREPRQA